MTSTKPSTAHPDLIPLLDKHGLTWEQFSRKGRLPKDLHWLAEKRRDVITELHLSGMSWARMIEVTGMSLGAIARGTRAVGNRASTENRRVSAAKTARARRGEKKPWLSQQLRQNWAAGLFDFHRGRIRSQEERDTLKAAALRPEVRVARSQSAVRAWQRPEHRAALLDYHRSDSVRTQRSQAQTRRMQEDPVKWSRGIGSYVEPKKCTQSRIWTRSSYERIAIELLDADPDVHEYLYEPRIELDGGRWILPDFVVVHKDGSIVLLEIKASWVLALPQDHRVQRRLHDASSFADSQGWDFLIWTEKDFDARQRCRG